MSFIPFSMASQAEFQRIVAGAVNPLLQGYPYPILDAAPSAVNPGYTYYDTVLGKVRTWDGSIWNNHF